MLSSSSQTESYEYNIDISLASEISEGKTTNNTNASEISEVL
jgi:hypothetical protein